MSGISHAVFLSYASQDAEAAQKICEALRAAGIELFLDQSELRSGDAWDQKIRREIHDCALFIPVISANTASRHEGYFRLEWDLADQRTHMIARSRVFVVPVCLDATTEVAADVPESFKRVQWTRLSGGETPPAFVERVRQLLSAVPSDATMTTALPARPAPAAAARVNQSMPASWRWKRTVYGVVAVVLIGAFAFLIVDKFWVSKRALEAPAAMGTAPATAVPATGAAFAPPPHSIAVLPFVNMSGDKEQEYFSEGLTEELLNSLARINELQVAARTSSFSFQGEHPDIATVAHKLNVASVLEGSVRRSGHTVRITAQLINAVTGFHLWSHTYDRDLGDVLKLETEIADAVASALKVSLLGDVATKLELGGTRNPDAFDAYLRAAKAYNTFHEEKDLQVALAAYTEAIRLDPKYALAYADRSEALITYASFEAASASHGYLARAYSDARTAIVLAPDLADGHLALEGFFEASLDFAKATEEYHRALALAPGNARVLRNYGLFTVEMGHFDVGIAAAQRAVVLDPLNRISHSTLGVALTYARKYDEAVAAFHDALAIDPGSPESNSNLGLAYYALGNFEGARSVCESKPDFWGSQWCMAPVYEKLGRHADAEAQVAKLKASQGDGAAYQYAAIYTQWGNTAKALEWLETALRLRDPGLVGLKTDPLLDPLRKEPRFQAIERELKFPA